MKKVLSIFAVAVFTLGLFSCESDNLAETQTLYEVDACDGCSDPPTGRDDNG